jgi:hypothetical protein
MKVQLQPELAKRKPLAELAEAATPVLEDAIGESAERVTATWDFEPDEQGRPLLRLTLADWSEEASALFNLDELRAPERAEWRFSQLWGTLLDEALSKRLKSLQAAVVQDQDG